MFNKKAKPESKAKSKATIDRSNIYTTGQIGRTRETTPEGYLLCRHVPIARFGKLMYGDGEVPVTADDKGLIIIERDEDALFNPQTIASFEAKPITDDHPNDWVSPENHKTLSNGTVHDVRRGEGIESDFLLADLLITNKDTIDAVMDGKVEISLGYDADYDEIAVGKGIQTNIFGNHIALVEKGRCGSRCSIGDSFMANKTKTPWYQTLLGMKRTIDEALEETDQTTDSEEETENDDKESTKTGDAKFHHQVLKLMKTMDARLDALEKIKTKDADTEETDEEETQTEDDILDAEKAEKAEKLSEEGVQNHTGDALKDVLSRAEILAPGIKLPTMDSVNNRNAVLNAKRAALKQAFTTDAGQKAIAPFIGTHTNFDAMPAPTIDMAFTGAAELIKQQNNTMGVRSGVTTKDWGRAAASPQDINARNREFWNKGK